MARPLRIVYEGAIYHVTVRGHSRGKMFEDDVDRRRFLERLEYDVEAFGVRLYAYALMANHYHLLLETPRANISSFMQSLQTSYHLYYNRRHHRCGQVSQGRFKAKVVDVGRGRSLQQDQAELLAQYLAMHHRFHPAIQLEEEKYGDALLSRFPMEVVKAGALPYRKARWVDEPRGALWARIEIGGGRHIHVFNTHLGLWKKERREQAEALLGPEWIGHPDCDGPVILCGDFNSGPESPVCRGIKKEMRDVQDNLPGHRPHATFSGRFPLHRVDHIFISDQFNILDVKVPATHLARVASDHLPLVAELSL